MRLAKHADPVEVEISIYYNSNNGHNCFLDQQSQIHNLGEKSYCLSGVRTTCCKLVFAIRCTEAENFYCKAKPEVTNCWVLVKSNGNYIQIHTPEDCFREVLLTLHIYFEKFGIGDVEIPGA